MSVFDAACFLHRQKRKNIVVVRTCLQKQDSQILNWSVNTNNVTSSQSQQSNVAKSNSQSFAMCPWSKNGEWWAPTLHKQVKIVLICYVPVCHSLSLSLCLKFWEPIASVTQLLATCVACCRSVPRHHHTLADEDEGHRSRGTRPPRSIQTEAEERSVVTRGRWQTHQLCHQERPFALLLELCRQTGW